MPRLSKKNNINDLVQLECYKMGCVFLTSRDIIVIRQLYSASESGQLKIDTGLVNEEWRPDVKLTTYVDCIDDICIDDIRSDRLPSVPDE